MMLFILIECIWEKEIANLALYTSKPKFSNVVLEENITPAILPMSGKYQNRE